MARRIVRTAIQLASIAVFTFSVVFFLDRNYRILPDTIHGYMPQHHPGLVLTDVTIATCSSLNPFSSCQLDDKIWHRVDKDLYLGKAWTTSAYIHVKRKHEEELGEDDSVVVGVAVGRLEPSPDPKSSDKWESRTKGLWIKRSKKAHSSDSDDAITGLDILYGDDATEARAGWEIIGTPLHMTKGSPYSVQLTVRRGHPVETKRPVPRIPDNGRLKIMQIADLHLSTGVGECRDAVPNSYEGGECEADPRTLDFVTKILDEEKPDLVILSGDQVNGESAPDAQSAMFKITAILIKRKIPYAGIFGNHDDKTLSRADQMAIMADLPYSLSRSGPEHVDGVGNYYVEVLGRGSTDHSALTIYLLDTHSYSPDERHWPGYDWIKQSQIDWFRKTAQSRKKMHAEYTHRHMDIAFIHIPLTEYGEVHQPRVGHWKEGVTAPLFNSGFRDALVEEGVVMVSAGHDHANDYCALSMNVEHKEGVPPAPDAPRTPALWMCYAGGVGFGGYGGYDDYHRRVRVFEVDTNDARIKTWKRLEYGDVQARIDEQIIVDGGKPIAPPPPPPPPAAKPAQQA